ncbi:hypothetical protein T484DRAFT_1955241 [Baffinella frigidus]|nr:hypothetical protein T484DRAFT_1955241 [Cryptophyta sp. CCMP2293]
MAGVLVVITVSLGLCDKTDPVRTHGSGRDLARSRQSEDSDREAGQPGLKGGCANVWKQWGSTCLESPAGEMGGEGF